MSISEKLAHAKESRWPADGLTDTEVRTAEEMAKISAKIEIQRKEKGLSRLQLADMMGVSEETVSDWESGEYDFRVSELIRLGYRLGLTFTYK